MGWLEAVGQAKPMGLIQDYQKNEAALEGARTTGLLQKQQLEAGRTTGLLQKQQLEAGNMELEEKKKQQAYGKTRINLRILSEKVPGAKFPDGKEAFNLSDSQVPMWKEILRNMGALYEEGGEEYSDYNAIKEVVKVMGTQKEVAKYQAQLRHSDKILEWTTANEKVRKLIESGKSADKTIKGPDNIDRPNPNYDENLAKSMAQRDGLDKEATALSKRIEDKTDTKW